MIKGLRISRMNYGDRGAISFGGLRLQSLPKTFARACKIEKKEEVLTSLRKLPTLKLHYEYTAKRKGNVHMPQSY